MPKIILFNASDVKTYSIFVFIVLATIFRRTEKKNSWLLPDPSNYFQNFKHQQKRQSLKIRMMNAMQKGYSKSH